jgi:hypothetical protein
MKLAITNLEPNARILFPGGTPLPGYQDHLTREDVIMLTLQFGDWLTVAVLIGVAQFLSSIWIKARLEASIKSEYDRRLEDYRYEIRVREQAAKAAEYLSLAWRLEESDPKEVYHRVNQLGWELAMWLPADTYKAMVLGIAKNTETENPLATIISIRKLLLGTNSGILVTDNIASHAPGIGKRDITRSCG